MRVHSLDLIFLVLCSLFVLSFCNADEKTFEVVGIGECSDCNENNLKTSDAFSGLHVTIDCKLKTGKIKRVGGGELDEGGKFKISLPQEVVQDEKNLKEECYAQLHSAAAAPCPAHNGLDATKIVFKSQTSDKSTFGPIKTVGFSSAVCTSKSFLPYFKYPPFSKTHNWKKNWPKKWPCPPPAPVYKPKPTPNPPTVKTHPPPAPIYKPKPSPPTPIYKPKPPVVKPFPPPAPIYKPKPSPPTPIYKPKPPVVKPFPPPAPIYKPKPPVYEPPKKPLPPPAPIYKPAPVVTKPLPPPFPLYPIPPFYKKPCPPFSKIPPKYFNHPKFGYFPPLPPLFPQP